MNKIGAIIDLVVLSEDTQNTKTIEKVITGGRIYIESEILSHIPDLSKIEKKYDEFERESMEKMVSAEVEC